MKNKNWGFNFSIIILLIIPFTVFANYADEVKLLASDGAEFDMFGWSVSVSGDTLISGAKDDDDNGDGSGSAYFFTLDPVTGLWSEQQKITASDGAASDEFGYSVSISGDVAVVGALYDFVGVSANAGSAYIFVRDPVTGNWTEEQKLLPQDVTSNARFGQSVAINGDTVVVGSPGKYFGSANAGAAYVFVRDTNTGNWSEQQKLVSTGLSGGDNFGISVAIDGDSVSIGATGEDDNGTDSGAVFVFLRDTGVWTQQQKLLATDGEQDDWMGWSVSISGDVVIAGAPQEDENAFNAGATYLYERNSGVWTQQQKFLSSDGGSYDSFGDEVSIVGENAVIGAYGNGSPSGSAYVYKKDTVSGIWLEDQKIVSPDDVGISYFARTISLSNSLLVIGSRSDDDIGTYAGAVHVYTSSGGTVASPEITITDSVVPVADLSLEYGDITEFSFSDQTVTVTNDGTADLVMGAVSATDTLSTPFAIETDGCSSQTLAPAANCAISIRFEPQSTGAFTDSFDIPSNDADESSVVISVSGSGIGLPVADISVIDSIAPVDDLQIDFGDVTQASLTSETVTITNVGDANLNIGNIGNVNVLALPFSIINDNCSSQTILPLASCTIGIQFEPTVAGSFSDSLDIASNDADEPSVVVSVSGTGVSLPVPDITVIDTVDPVNDLQLLFGNVAENSTATKQVNLTNDGSADLIMGQIGVANALSAPFQLENDTCSGQTLNPSATCSITIRFSPTSVAVFNDSLDFPSNDTDENPVTFNVSGEGVVANTVDVGGNPSSSSGGSLGLLEILFGLAGFFVAFRYRDSH